MSESQKLGKAVDICSEIRYGINALNAVHSAMIDGPTSPESFIDGLYCVWSYLSDKAKALERVLEDGEECSYE